MRYYMVLQQEKPGRAPQVRLLKDGFSWWAFAFGPLWLAWHRSWRTFLVSIAVLIVAAIVSRELSAWASIAMSIIIGFEGAAIAAEAMQRRGWRFLGMIAAPDMDAAELRLAEGLLISDKTEKAATPEENAAPLAVKGGQPA